MFTRGIGKILMIAVISHLLCHPINAATESKPLSRLEVRGLLKGKSYQRLNNILEDYRKRHIEDVKWESPLDDAYKAFVVNSIDFELALSQWVKSTPSVYQPYLARAYYYTHMGWESRGYKWAKETSDEQFRKMNYYFELARRDIGKVLEIDPNSLLAMNLLLTNNRAQSRDQENMALIQRALKCHPHSFLLRASYMNCLLPRWGGSYYRMEQFAKEAQKFANINPQLKVLQGFVYEDQADYACRDKRFANAIELCNEALAYGDYWRFYQARSDVYYSSNDLIRALRDIERAIGLRPEQEGVYIDRAYICSALGKIDEANDCLNRAEELAPGYSLTRRARRNISSRLVVKGYELTQNKKYTEALTDYNQAIKICSDNEEAYYYRGFVYIELRQLNKAFNDFNQAILINPDYFEAYRIIDWVLARERRWDEIIGYWDRYIKRNPQNGNAYLERGGAYYHKGDYRSSMEDAKKAWELGVPEGRQRYEQMKKLLGLE